VNVVVSIRRHAVATRASQSGRQVLVETCSDGSRRRAWSTESDARRERLGTQSLALRELLPRRRKLTGPVPLELETKSRRTLRAASTLTTRISRTAMVTPHGPTGSGMVDARRPTRPVHTLRGSVDRNVAVGATGEDAATTMASSRTATTMLHTKGIQAPRLLPLRRRLPMDIMDTHEVDRTEDEAMQLTAPTRTG
jgi:hypothetical protein